ncbi:MAG: hypothetical protein ABIQ91_01755 [Candidatus Paceibacterota bacterium]
MSELHNRPINDDFFVLEEGQGGSLCSNKESFPCPSLGVRNILTKDTIDALEGLGEVLRGIRKRMLSEGYEIHNGAVSKKHEQANY